MSGTQGTEYAEFYLVDPRRLGDRFDAAIVMIIGALLPVGTILSAEGSPRSMAAVVNRGITGLHHTQKGRRALQRQATKDGTWLLYYCSLCGGRLLASKCAGCGRRYDIPVGNLGGRQPTLPRRIAAYAVRHGHRFER